MTKVNQRLAAATLVLLVVSAFLYWDSVTRAERFERGQKFLQNLNPDEIASIAIEKGEERVTLRRQGEEFVVEEANGYLAKNEAVNRFVRDLLDLSLEKEVGSSEALAEELGIEPPGEETIEVTLANAADQEMVRLRVGDRFEGGNGHYVRRLDGEGEPIYLTSKSVFLSTGQDAFLDKEIVDVASADVERIEGPDFVFAKEEEGGGLKLTEMPAGRKEKSVETSRVKNALSRLNFDKVWVADDPEVSDLEFEQVLRFDLEDDTGYLLSVAEKGERNFLQIKAFHTIERIEIERDTPDEELQEKAEVLSRADEVQEFNAFHGSWVYEVSDTTAEKLGLEKSDLLEETT